jgi:hypothetical protein
VGFRAVCWVWVVMGWGLQGLVVVLSNGGSESVKDLMGYELASLLRVLEGRVKLMLIVGTTGRFLVVVGESW